MNFIKGKIYIVNFYPKIPSSKLIKCKFLGVIPNQEYGKLYKFINIDGTGVQWELIENNLKQLKITEIKGY